MFHDPNASDFSPRPEDAMNDAPRVTLEAWIRDRITRMGGGHLSHRDRDIEIVLTYFGLRGLNRPTLDKVQGVFPDVTTRERIRQVLDKRFREAALACRDEWTGLVEAVLQGRDVVSFHEVRETLRTRGFDIGDVSPESFQRLVGELGLADGVDIYGIDFRQPIRSTEGGETGAWFATEAGKDALQLALRTCRGLPAKVGIVADGDLGAALENVPLAIRPVVAEVLLRSPEFFRFAHRGQGYFIREQGRNPLLKAAGKVGSLDLAAPTHELAEVLHFALKTHTARGGLGYPEAQVIEAWILASDLFSHEGGRARFLGKVKEPTQWERLAHDHALANPGCGYVELRDRLMAAGCKEPTAVKAIKGNPLLWVDRNQPRKSQRHVALGTADGDRDAA